MNPQLFTQPQSDYNLDDLANKDGELYQLPTISLELKDEYIIKNLHNIIEDSKDYYNDINHFNLKNKRLKNAQMLQGQHLAENKLYRHQTPFIDNEIFVGIDSILAYVCAQTPRAEVYPASDKKDSIVLAQNLEKYMLAHSEKFELPRKMEGAVYNLIGKYVGLIKLRWDPLSGEHGEIVPEVVDPNHVIIDKNAKLGENPRFICHVLRDSVEGLVSKFPDKEEAILQHFTIKRKGSRNMSAEVAYREVWFTYYDDNKPKEAVAWYVDNIVLDKSPDPNWLHDGEGANFLDTPMKPFIPFNLTNDGSHWLDRSNALDQAIPQQDILNKLGRQVLDNLATANGFKVIDSHAMTKDDAQNFTGDPNQLLLVKTKPGQNVSDVVAQLTPQIVSSELIAQLATTKQTIHGILGTPTQFTGSDEGQTETASEALMIKNQASGRQDKIVRAVDYAMDRYFKFLAQMITVWYTEKHYATINGGDGKFDFIEMHKDKIEKGMSVRVQSGTTLPFDKTRQESVGLNLAKMGLLSPYDVYKLLHMEQPQKLYDNFMKWKSDPTALSMDISGDDADTDAVVDWTELMAGRTPAMRDDPTQHYVEQMRKLLITDEFRKAKPKIQSTVIKFINEAVDSLELHNELEEASGQKPEPVPLPQAVLDTGVQQVQPVMPMGSPMGAPMMPPMGAPMGAPQGMPQPAPAMPQMPPASPMQSIMQQGPVPGVPPTVGMTPPGQMPQGPMPMGGGQPQVNLTNPNQLPGV